jgi:hypothetical protein
LSATSGMSSARKRWSFCSARRVCASAFSATAASGKKMRRPCCDAAWSASTSTRSSANLTPTTSTCDSSRR